MFVALGDRCALHRVRRTLLIAAQSAIADRLFDGREPLHLWLANCCFAHNSLRFPALYHSSMRHLVVLFIHFIATLARLLGPGGVRSLVAESLLLKHQR